MRVKKLYTGTAAQKIDRIAIEEFGYSGFGLMKAAGEAAYALINDRYLEEKSTAQLLILCGAGNNGGDGYIIARCLFEVGHVPYVVALATPKTSEARRAQKEFHAAGGNTVEWSEFDFEQDFHLVVDAMLGTGLNAAPREGYAQAIKFSNQLKAHKFAVDVPSGTDADSGRCFQPCFEADATMTFIVPKVGLLTGEALNYVGDLSLESLGVTEEVCQEVVASALSYDPRPLASRAKDSHKGSFGHGIIAGGDEGMFGATLLAGEAALRAGCGKVTVLSSEENLDKPALYQPELMSSASRGGELPSGTETASAIGVGPGLGLGTWSENLLESVLSVKIPKVLDADALTLVSKTQASLPANTILTPHPGEAASLLQCSSRDVQLDRLNAACEIAKRYQVICVLKGAGSLIADPSGDLLLCARGNPAMATAGMGDVLTGIVVALLAQGYKPFRAAYTAVWLHAAAADDLVYRSGYRTLLASDVAKHLAKIDI